MERMGLHCVRGGWLSCAWRLRASKRIGGFGRQSGTKFLQAVGRGIDEKKGGKYIFLPCLPSGFVVMCVENLYGIRRKKFFSLSSEKCFGWKWFLILLNAAWCPKLKCDFLYKMAFQILLKPMWNRSVLVGYSGFFLSFWYLMRHFRMFIPSSLLVWEFFRNLP